MTEGEGTLDNEKLRLKRGLNAIFVPGTVRRFDGSLSGRLPSPADAIKEMQEFLDEIDRLGGVPIGTVTVPVALDPKYPRIVKYIPAVVDVLFVKKE